MSSVTSVSMFSVTSSSFPKTPVAYSPRFSRVSFASASMHSEGGIWRLKATSGDEKSVFEEKINEAQKAAAGFNEAVKEKADEINKGMKGKGDEINEMNKGNLQSIKDKNDEIAGVVSENLKEAGKKAEKVKEALEGKE